MFPGWDKVTPPVRYVILFGGGLSYLFWLQVVLIRTQPEKTCPTKNVVFIGVSGFVVLMQSYHLLPYPHEGP